MGWWMVDVSCDGCREDGFLAVWLFALVGLVLDLELQSCNRAIVHRASSHRP